MNILQVTEFFTPKTGGSTQVAYQTARHLARRGHRVTLCTSDFGQKDAPFPDIQFEVQAFKSLPTRWKFYVTPGLIGWAARNVKNYNVIHMHNVRTFQNVVIGYYARKYQVPYLISAHGSLPFLNELTLFKKIFDVFFGKRLVAGARSMIAVSDVEIDQYLSFGISADRIKLQLNGLNLDDFCNLPPKGDFRKNNRIPFDQKLVLYLGRLHRRKAIHHLVTAFAHHCENRQDSYLVIAGPDEGSLNDLREMAARFGLADRILFPGPLYGRDKLSAYVDSDILVSPSTMEIFGLVPFEALLCGTAVIVADDCGSGRLIESSKAGYVYPFGDIGALQDLLARALDHPNERRWMAERGKAFIQSTLDWEKAVVGLEEIYQSCDKDS